jgi:hypothetical protein
MAEQIDLRALNICSWPASADLGVAAKPSRPVERYFSHSQLFIQADCSRGVVHLNFQIDMLHAPTSKFPKYFPQQCRRNSAPTR